MALRDFKLPLFNDTYYSYNVSLEGNSYTLEFLFLERMSSWLLSLLDSEGNYLVRNQRLTPNTLLFAEYRIQNLTGGFYFTPKSNQDSANASANIRFPADSYNLFYLFDDGE